MAPSSGGYSGAREPAPAKVRGALAALVATLLLLAGILTAASADTGSRMLSGLAQCTTNSSGVCTVQHTLGVAPTAILLTPVISSSGSSYMLNVVDGSVTATAYKVRARTAASSNAANRALKFYFELIGEPVAPPTTPSTTPSTSGTASTSVPPSSSTSASPTTSPTTSTTPPPSSGSLADRYKRWSAGPNPTGDPNVFPVSVWMQGAERHPPGETKPNGQAYQEIGVPQNLGMPEWPAGADKPWVQWRMDAAVETGWHDMPWVSDGARAQVQSNPDIAKVARGYTLGDEADQNKSNGNAADKPANYKAAGAAAQAADPTRPIYSNFGAAFANRWWNGYTPDSPGATREDQYKADMALYCESSGIVSVDIYAYTNGWLGGASDPRRQAWYYGQTIDNLKFYCGPDKISWGFVETGHPFGEFSWTDRQYWITPDQMENAIWNMIVHGADGIVYFAHDFGSGELIDDGMLRHPDIKARAAAVNARIQSLAAVLNAPSKTGVSVATTGDIPVSYMYKQTTGSDWIVAQADGTEKVPGSGATTATFTVPMQSGQAEVVGEGRMVPIVGGKIVDNFAAYGFHVYKW